MDALVLASRLLLAAVFVVAAVAKLSDRGGTRDAVEAFGAPKRAGAVLALGLPAAELAVAVLLLPSATALAGALGALVLLALFSAAIALNLVRGRAPECHCFGQLHSEPAGPRTLVRNGALAGVAAFAVVGTAVGADPSAVAWVGRLDGPEAAIAAAAGGAALILGAGAIAYTSLLRAYGRVLLRLERAEATLAAAGLQVDEAAADPQFGLEPGTPAPAFAELDGLLAPALPLLLVIARTHFVPCNTLLSKVDEWQVGGADRLTVAVASAGDPDEVRAEAEALGLGRVIVDEDLELYRAFEANGTPSAVLIDPDGSVASWVAPGPSRIEALAAIVLDAPGVPVGAPVPELELPSLEGERLRLAALRGRDTLLLFWNPSCGYCRAMHDDLLAWEAGANGPTPRLVVVSMGDEEATRAEGFASEVVLDEDRVAGSEFGIHGTPMAVLLGADGRVASGVAMGAQAVMALARPRDSGEVLTLG